jgi:hypothetical protein
MNKTSITVQNEPMQLPCFNFFLGGVSAFVLPTVFSGKRIRFQMNILMKVQHLKQITRCNYYQNSEHPASNFWAASRGGSSTTAAGL